MGGIGKIFEKIPGYLFGFLAVAIGLGGVLIALVWHGYIEKVDIFYFWISNLGAGPDFGANKIGSETVFNVSIFSAGVLLFIYHIYMLNEYWHKDNMKKNIPAIFAIICGVVSSSGMGVVTIWDMFESSTHHVIGAFMFFIAAVFYVLFWTIAMRLSGQKSKAQLTFAIILIVTFALFLTVGFISGTAYGLIPAELTMADMIEFMSSMDSTVNPVRFMEWITLPLVFVWLLWTVFYQYMQVHFKRIK